jgi:hypothetical protein
MQNSTFKLVVASKFGDSHFFASVSPIGHDLRNYPYLPIIGPALCSFNRFKFLRMFFVQYLNDDKLYICTIDRIVFGETDVKHSFSPD